MTHIIFRKATPADASTLVDLIGALAAHEGRPEAATVNEAKLRALLFGDDGLANAYLGFVEEQVAAFAIVAERFSSFRGERFLYLEDMLVLDAFRGMGLGKQLFAFVANLALQAGYGSLSWSALDDNDVAIGFYNHINADEETGVLHFSMATPELQKFLESMS